jgi:hypothetical protein
MHSWNTEPPADLEVRMCEEASRTRSEWAVGESRTEESRD